MIIAGIIPARYASTRLPGKPLLPVHGKPMIQRVYEQSKKAKLLNRVIVATDDKRIFDCVNAFGGEVMMTSNKHQSGTDRLSEVAEKIKCDIVVNIQGDEPYIDPENIDLAIKPMLTDKSLDVSTLAIKIKNADDLKDVNKVKVVIDKNNLALYFSRNFIPYDMEQKVLKDFQIGNRIFYKHIGLYVYSKKYLLKFAKMKTGYLEKMEKLEQLRILESGDKIKVILTKKDSVSVDSPEDLKKLNRK
ncbi:MAG TPA: 3-deoxy-manno-octulosonate cytidylyltransferase [Ignavibacteria bacterium]|nr:3-deoxy-manno-octulosonate cytidylyltransferase [Ignavibacteria bacterium]HMR39158.1 3-deoxy-manno-octulosonate cytidylyltransferase [Ignavibacteria bacterium]